MAVLPPDPALAESSSNRTLARRSTSIMPGGRNRTDINIKLVSHLCPAHREAFTGQAMEDQIDWIDWTTGEVTRVDGLQHDHHTLQ